MDEVDGMGAGDRSGMAELINAIKETKVPIVSAFRPTRLLPFPPCRIRTARAIRVVPRPTRACVPLRARRY